MTLRFLPYGFLRVGVLAAIGLFTLGCGHFYDRLYPGLSKHDPKTPLPHGVQVSTFGRLASKVAVQVYTLTNKRGAVAKVMTRGATVTELWMPDKNRELADIVLGFKSLEQYEQKGNPYFGAIVGRYANRIAGGKFTLDGTDYDLYVNNGPNSLHGGQRGFDKVIWAAEPVESTEGPTVKFTYVSTDGEEGYPGNLTLSVQYTLTHTNVLKIEYAASTDQKTVLNVTNHSYFNLAGAGKGTILDHIAMINADQYTPGDEVQIPTGAIAPVKGTALDFTSPTPIGAHIGQVNTPPTSGYDHNYVVNGKPGELRFAAKVKDPKSGRVLEVSTTEPGMQLYTGNFLDGTVSGIGGVYPKNAAFCLETQHYPDSPNHPKFPTTVLKPGEVYRQTTTWKFTAE